MDLSFLPFDASSITISSFGTQGMKSSSVFCVFRIVGAVSGKE